MIFSLGGLLLLSVPGLPLLMVFPALRRRLRWPCHLALLPGMVLLLAPGTVSIDLPWMLWGSGLRLDGLSRWWLAMSLILWAVAATRLFAPAAAAANNRLTVFFLLTVAGNLGTILSTELVGFFAFSALMGYGFYGLLVDTGGPAAQRAGRLYLGLMILADLLLFDALLMLAATNGELAFAQAGRTAAGLPAPALYVSLVLVGFGLKAGIWPMHSWLPPAFASTRPAVALLIAGIPVATGLYGMLRWLPLGEVEFPSLGLIVGGVGVVAVLYAMTAVLKRGWPRLVPAYAVIIAGGAFVIALGTGLADPDTGHRIALVAPLPLAMMGLGLAFLAAGIGWWQTKTAPPMAPATVGSLWFERGYETARRWTQSTSKARATEGHGLAGVFRAAPSWKKALDDSEHSLRRWPVAITLLLLMAMLISLIVALAGASHPG